MSKQLILKLADGTITVSALIYMKLEKKFIDLTKVTTTEALQFITELTKTL